MLRGACNAMVVRFAAFRHLAPDGRPTFAELAAGMMLITTGCYDPNKAALFCHSTPAEPT